MGRIPLKGKGEVWEKRNPGKGLWRIKSAPMRRKASPPLWRRGWRMVGEHRKVLSEQEARPSAGEGEWVLGRLGAQRGPQMVV